MPEAARQPATGEAPQARPELTELELLVELLGREMAAARLRDQVERRLAGPLRRVEGRLERLERRAREAVGHA